MYFLGDFTNILLATCRDVLPIILLITGFQLFVLRQPIPHLRRLVVGGAYVVLGLALFLAGLEMSLFPLGKIMAAQLSDPEFLFGINQTATQAGWTAYAWIYLFAALLGFSTTIAEPSLIAVAYKANEASSGTVKPWGLRLTVAVGVSVGVTLGTFRIVTGTPLYMYILAGYLVVLIQTIFAPRNIIALAYDSGGVTSSTVTVPLVTALGLGLCDTIPGCNMALDGFGMIAFACLFPIIAVLGYAQAAHWYASRPKTRVKEKKNEI